MSFLNNDNTATTINNWYIEALYQIEELKIKKQSLINQLALMKTNTDYTEQDCNEVQILIDDINSKIELI